MSELNRRNFLKGAVAATASLAAAAALGGCSQTASSAAAGRSQQHCGQRSSPDHSRRPLSPVRYLRQTVHVRI